MTGRRVATTKSTTALDKADALQRAARTLWQGIRLDVLGAIGVGLAILLVDTDVTSGVFWGALGVLVLKSLLMSVAAYLQRLHKAPPPLPDATDPTLTDDYHDATPKP